jgi:outer membrane protein
LSVTAFAEDPVEEDAPFSLKEAVQHALKNNLSLKVGAFDPAIAQTDILSARSVFDPVLFADHTWSAFAEPLGNDFLGQTSRRQRRSGVGLRHQLPVGWRYAVEYRNDYDKFALDRNLKLATSENNVFLSVVVPFLRGAGSHINRAGIDIAELAYQSSLKAFEQSALDLVLEVEVAYWALVQARLVLDVRKRALQNSREFLGLLEKEIEYGKAAPYEAYEAQQNVSSRERDLEQGAQQVELTEQTLSRLLGIDPVTVNIIPTQMPSQDVPQNLPDLDEVVVEAIARRPLIEQVKLSLQVLNRQVEVAENDLLPSFNAVGEHRLGDSNASPYAWSVGLELELPLGNREARARRNRLQVAYNQTLTSKKDLEQRVRLEVAQALRTFDIATRRVKAAREASVMAEKRVEAELTRFRVGFTPSHRVIFAQQQQIVTDEDGAVSLVNLELARSAFRRAVGTALTEFQMRPVPQGFAEDKPDPRIYPEIEFKDASEEADPPKGS